MGCGKSKHDVVTGNTKTVKKPSEPESVRGKESQTIKTQGSCRCRKIDDVSPAVSSHQPETNVDNNTEKPVDKEAGGDCNEKAAKEINDVQKTEEKEVKETTPPQNVIVPENVVAEETVNNVIEENVLPIDEQTEKVEVAPVVEEDKFIEDKNDGDVVTETPVPDVETETQVPEVEEPKPDVEIPVPTELEVQKDLSTENVETTATENEETAATENNEIPVVEDEEKVDAVEEKSADIPKEVESA